MPPAAGAVGSKVNALPFPFEKAGHDLELRMILKMHEEQVAPVT